MPHGPHVRTGGVGLGRSTEEGLEQGKELTAESLEGRPGTKENVRQSRMRPTQCGLRMSQGLAGVRR